MLIFNDMNKPTRSEKRTRRYLKLLNKSFRLMSNDELFALLINDDWGYRAQCSRIAANWVLRERSMIA